MAWKKQINPQKFDVTWCMMFFQNTLFRAWTWLNDHSTGLFSPMKLRYAIDS